MKTLILNGASVVQNSFNDTYQYNFPAGQVRFEPGDQIALTSLAMYYSWNNVTSASTGSQYNNDSFSYTWIDGTTHQVLMPDGFYAISDINAYLQKTMVANAHYMTGEQGQFVYFLEVVENAVYYSAMIDAYNVPTSAEATALGYTMPGGATWSLPASTTTPQLTIPTNNFGLLLGFKAGTYPPTPQATAYNILSNNGVPQITPATSVVAVCSLLNNPYSIPQNLLYSFAPNVTFGSQISISPPQFSWIDITPGVYSNFTLTFKDQNFNRLAIQDTNLVVMLTIRERGESTGK